MTFLLALLLSPLILLTACLAVELFSGMRPLAPTISDRPASSNAVIIVPAHNEASILGSRLGLLKAAAAASQSVILVVADNCTDSTADIARAAQVRVVERHDLDRRGKGFALDFGRSAISQTPPDAVLVIDADCVIDAPSIELLIATCLAHGRPCQATNLQAPSPDASPVVQLSTFAFYVKNVVRQRAMQRLAGQVHLLGTGMAFPWPVFLVATLATEEIVEDLTLGLELTALGFPPLFAELAAVWSDAESHGNTLVQRRRWEGGFLANAVRAGPGMLVKSIGRGNPRGVWAAINVIIPPLALLMLLDLAALAISALLIAVTGAAAWPALVLGGTLLAATLGLGAAWHTGGKRFISLRGLSKAPLYILWKLPLYSSLARSRGPQEWARTRGDNHD